MNEDIFKRLDVLLAFAIEEDIGSGDITSQAIFGDGDISAAVIISKEKGIFCGIDVAKFCYNRINSKIQVEPIVPEGAEIKMGDAVMKMKGPTLSVLAGERIVLNFLQRMCGIATRTHFFVSLVENTGIKILDTRKTIPGYRQLDKYAVRTGGGTNHRMGLHDMIMIKDNHIKAAGDIRKAVHMVREKHRSNYTIEVEATTPEEVTEAVSSGADIIMLDNMDRENIIESMKIIDGKAKIEISGNMNEEKITMLRDLKIDYISIGSLTHSVQAFDLSMKFL